MEKLTDFKLLGKRINKEEEYRSDKTCKISVKSYLSDPLGGKSIDPLVTLITFTYKVRNSRLRYSLFKEVVQRQFPKFASIRWHIKFYIIEFFIEVV